MKLNRQSFYLIILTSFFAIFFSNISYLDKYYFFFIEFDIKTKIFNFSIKENIVNDFILSIYLFFVIIESKTYILKRLKYILLIPMLFAIVGVIIPMLLFLSVMYFSSESYNIECCIIPIATDILFCSCIMYLFKNFKSDIRKFILIIAIFDDILAIIFLSFIDIKNTENLLSYIIIFMFIIYLTKYIKNKYIRILLSFLPLLYFGYITFHFKLFTILYGIIIKFYFKKESILLLKKFSFFFVIPIFIFFNLGIKINFFYLFDIIFISIFISLIFGKIFAMLFSILLLQKLKFNIFFYKNKLNINQSLAVSTIFSTGFTMSIIIGSAVCPDKNEIINFSILISSLFSFSIGYVLFKKQFS